MAPGMGRLDVGGNRNLRHAVLRVNCAQLFAAMGLGVVLTQPIAAQTAPEVIRGRVTTDSGVALGGARIFATMGPDRLVFSAVSDGRGEYVISIPNGTGDYFVHVSAPGRRPFSRRVTRVNNQAVFVVDAVLSLAVDVLAPVIVAVQRPVPERGPPAGRETGALEQTIDGIHGALSPGEASDIAAAASTIPGVNAVAGGFSVLGMGPDQNRTSLNGLSFAGGEIPHGVTPRIRLYTSAYDPAHGGFAGGDLSIELPGGSVFTRSRVYLVLDAPALQSRAQTATQMPRGFTRLLSALSRAGRVGGSRFFYNGSAQLSHRTAAGGVGLLDGQPSVHALGIDPDTLTRLREILTSLGIPTASETRRGSVSQNGSLIARLDFNPYDAATGQISKTTWGMIAYGSFARGSQSVTQSLFNTTAAPELSAKRGHLQFFHSSFLRNHILNETRTAVSVSRDRSGGLGEDFPSGQVLLTSDGGINEAAPIPFAFGGAISPFQRESAWSWESSNTTQISFGAHKLKISEEWRFDRSDRSQASNPFGAFSFHSLADLAADRAASFSRTVVPQVERANFWSGALSVGDLWRPRSGLELLYGLRIGASGFVSRTNVDDSWSNAWELRGAGRPVDLSASPRFGFTWMYGSREGASGLSLSNIGTLYTGPRGVIRGGIGEFRGVFLPVNVRGTLASLSSSSSVHCIGPNTPNPDWRSYTAPGAPIPSQCAGADPTNALRNLEFYASDFRAPRSWRSSLGWDGSVGKFDVAIDGLYSLNLSQPGARDLNLAGAPRFTLGGELDRPVYAEPLAFQSSSGLVALEASRVDPIFGRVMQFGSENKSVSRQITVILSPRLDFSRYFLRGSYTLSNTRARVAGFNGSTAGDPRTVEWARSDFDVRHQVTAQAGFSTTRLTLALFVKMASGLPYTPLVRGDVNGDGAGNDRAFLSASLLNAIGSGAPARARECVERQAGRIAGHNSCEGPWTTFSNLRITPTPRALRARRINFNVNVSNPLGVVDRLINGAPRGWGLPAIPDPIASAIRGFDPSANAFSYEPNPRFGRSQPLSTSRLPFRISVDVSFDLSPTFARQQLDRWVRPGRDRAGPKLNAADIQQRYARNVPDLYTSLLDVSDSLLLSRDQVEALRVSQVDYRRRVDSIWADLANYLAALPNDFDVTAALARQEHATDEVWEISRQEAQRLPSILSAVQLRVAPWPANILYRTKEKTRFRAYLSL